MVNNDYVWIMQLLDYMIDPNYLYFWYMDSKDAAIAERAGRENAHPNYRGLAQLSEPMQMLRSELGKFEFLAYGDRGHYFVRLRVGE